MEGLGGRSSCFCFCTDPGGAPTTSPTGEVRGHHGPLARRQIPTTARGFHFAGRSPWSGWGKNGVGEKKSYE